MIRAENEGAKRIIVLSDDDTLARAVQIGLQPHGGVLRLGAGARARERLAETAEPVLIVVALSLSTSEPVVLLARAGLGVYLGQIPILIVSDRPFQPEQAERISHYSFPFSSDAFSRRVAELLDDTPAPRLQPTEPA